MTERLADWIFGLDATCNDNDETGFIFVQLLRIDCMKTEKNSLTN